MGKRRGRPRKPGPRKLDGTLERGKFTPPPEHILERRKLFSFVTPTKGPDGRSGEIDQDVCDGIGQFHALGLLDGHPIDALELRNIGREWRDWFVTLLRRQGFKGGGYERMDKAREREPRASERLDRMDDALSGFERSALMSLLIDPAVGSWPLGQEEAPWVRAIVDTHLLDRRRIAVAADEAKTYAKTTVIDGKIAYEQNTYTVSHRPIMLANANDYALLAAAIRGLFTLHDASLPGRYERRAA